MIKTPHNIIVVWLQERIKGLEEGIVVGQTKINTMEGLQIV